MRCHKVLGNAERLHAQLRDRDTLPEVGHAPRADDVSVRNDGAAGVEQFAVRTGAGAESQ